MKVSNCCGVHPAQIEDMDSTDYGICPKCGEHCEYVEICEDCGEDEKYCKCANVQATKDATAAVDLFKKMGEIFAPISLSTIKKK